MKNFSIWTEYYNKNEKINILNKDEEFDVVIIGGGITGLSSAYNFFSDKMRVCVLEKNLIGRGITSKTTAKISYLQESIYSNIKNLRNYDDAKLYYESQKMAIDNIVKIINDNNIECDLTKSDSYLFAQNNKQLKKIQSEKELLESFNEKVSMADTLPDGLKIRAGIKVTNTYTFNPIKYLNGIKSIIQNKIPIYENSCVTKIKYQDEIYYLSVNNCTVKTKNIIMCTHYPYFLFPYLMPLKCSLEKSYIGVYKDMSNLNFQAITSMSPVSSIRYIEGKGTRYKLILTNSCNLALSQNDLDNFLPLVDKKPDYLWSNIDIISADYLPIIGLIDKNFYIATGYNTWGMTNSMLASIVIHDLISNKENKYANLVNPKRNGNIKINIKYPLYLINNAYSFINSKIIKNKNWYSKNVRFTKINRERVGIYKDKSGKEYVVKNKCPHLGCSLIFNEIEFTWDCPCHGSRFNIMGKSIEGPSNYDITFKPKD